MPALQENQIALTELCGTFWRQEIRYFASDIGIPGIAKHLQLGLVHPHNFARRRQRVVATRGFVIEIQGFARALVHSVFELPRMALQAPRAHEQKPDRQRHECRQQHRRLAPTAFKIDHGAPHRQPKRTVLELAIHIHPLHSVDRGHRLVHIARLAWCAQHHVANGLRHISIPDLTLRARQRRVTNNLGEVFRPHIDTATATQRYLGKTFTDGLHRYGEIHHAEKPIVG